jgi:hypothetical protein
LQRALVDHLTAAGHEVIDHGPLAYDAMDDYPVFVLRAAQAVAADPGSAGIVLGGSGNGEVMAANKVPGIRAAYAASIELAELAREHNDAQIISILPPGPLVISFGYLLAWMTVQLFIYPGTRTSAFVGFGSVLAGMVVMYVLSASRASRGLVGFAGDRILFELTHRQRLLAQLPPLPAGWRAECVVAGADGEEFSGDFLLCTQSGRDHLEIVLVDVSGKGLRAGTRSLMLSSAFSGLLGRIDADRFLPAANSYLVRQDWREGFATAVHLDLDLTTGSFELGLAGHPPAIHFDSARGRWESVLSRSGPVLGAMDGMSFPQTSGRLNPGDALLLYTDGVIESRTNQLADGIDWMLGAIETYGVSFPGAAQRLVRGAQGGSGDDRGVVLIWRE